MGALWGQSSSCLSILRSSDFRRRDSAQTRVPDSCTQAGICLAGLTGGNHSSRAAAPTLFIQPPTPLHGARLVSIWTSQSQRLPAERKELTLQRPGPRPEASTGPQDFRLPGDLQLPACRVRERSESCGETGGVSATGAPSNTNGICSHQGLTALRDQKAEDG